MNPRLLPLLQAHLQQALSTLTLVGQSGKDDIPRSPQIFIGDLPTKRREKDAREIPCVVIVPLSGHQQDGATVAEVALVCAVYNKEEGDAAGCEGDMALLLSAITRALVPCANGAPLGRRFNLEADSKGRLLPWTKDDKQPQPFMQAVMTSLWTGQGWE